MFLNAGSVIFYFIAYINTVSSSSDTDLITPVRCSSLEKWAGGLLILVPQLMMLTQYLRAIYEAEYSPDACKQYRSELTLSAFSILLRVCVVATGVNTENCNIIIQSDKESTLISILINVNFILLSCCDARYYYDLINPSRRDDELDSCFNV